MNLQVLVAIHLRSDRYQWTPELKAAVEMAIAVRSLDIAPLAVLRPQG